MTAPERFPYVVVNPMLGKPSAAPILPIELEFSGNVVVGNGLVDSGSSLNVLPYDVGLQLGADWNQQTVSIQLTGNLANLAAKTIVLNARVGQFAPVRLAFAWTQSDQVPIILGQVNFFTEFDVCFFRSQNAFEVRPAA